MNAINDATRPTARTRDASHPGFAAGQGSAPLLYASVRVQLKGANYANAPELQAIDAGMVFAGSEYEREINDFCAENTKPPANQGRGRPKASASKKKRPRYEEADSRHGRDYSCGHAGDGGMIGRDDEQRVMDGHGRWSRESGPLKRLQGLRKLYGVLEGSEKLR